MEIPPFPDILELSDYDQGALLLGYFIMVQAADIGLPIDCVDRFPDEFAERVRQYALTIETATSKNAAVEKALHKAASGDFEGAGKFLREHMLDGAIALKFIPIGINKSAQAVTFGHLGAKAKKAEREENEAIVNAAICKIRSSWKSLKAPSGRDLARRVADETGLPFDTVRNHINKNSWAVDLIKTSDSK